MTAKSPSHKAMGELLKAIRVRNKLTLQDITRDLKIETSGLSRVERGIGGFTQEVLVKLLAYYGISLPEVIAKAAGITEEDILNARVKGRTPQEETATGGPCFEQAADGWATINPVLSVRQYAGSDMYLCRRSFENTEYELIYKGKIVGGLSSMVAAKQAAPNFARRVISDECKQILG